jgi:hypothetical protein
MSEPAPEPAPETELAQPEPPAPEPAKPEPDDEAFDKDRAMATIHKLREQEKAGKAAARERDELKARLEALEHEKLSDQEKQAKRLADLEAEKADWERERQETRLRLAVHDRASLLGIADADLALAALDRSQLEYDKSGEATNLDELLLTLLEAKPLLKGAAAAASTSHRTDGGMGRTAGPAPALTADELEVAKQRGMSPEYYAALKNVNNVDEFEAVRRKFADVP